MIIGSLRTDASGSAVDVNGLQQHAWNGRPRAMQSKVRTEEVHSKIGVVEATRAQTDGPRGYQ